MRNFDFENAVAMIDRFSLWEDMHDHWFGDAITHPQALPEQLKLWFFRDDQKDIELKQKFETWLVPAASGELRSWHGSPRSALSLVILLDQIPRNIYRGYARSFHFDETSLQLATKFVKLGFDRQLHPLERVFLYLPFQHSEKLEDQKKSLEFFNELERTAVPQLKEFFKICQEKAVLHLEAIERFGRFPHRNLLLGRRSTPEEAVFLRNPKSWF